MLQIQDRDEPLGSDGVEHKGILGLDIVLSVGVDQQSHQGLGRRARSLMLAAVN
jgi:hypothetical protein